MEESASDHCLISSLVYGSQCKTVMLRPGRKLWIASRFPCKEVKLWSAAAGKSEAQRAGRRAEDDDVISSLGVVKLRKRSDFCVSKNDTRSSGSVASPQQRDSSWNGHPSNMTGSLDPISCLRAPYTARCLRLTSERSAEGRRFHVDSMLVIIGCLRPGCISGMVRRRDRTRRASLEESPTVL